MEPSLKNPPTYAVVSVDHALRLASILQLEGSLTVSLAAQRLGVARSTAHRLLSMLVYRDFAVQDEHHVYHAGPILEFATHSTADAARLRAAAMPRLDELVEMLDETTSISIRTGHTTRFLATAECRQSPRVTSREGMVFPAERTTTGMLALAEFAGDELAQFLESPWYADSPTGRPDRQRLRADLARVRSSGFALNEGRSERGLIALGVPVRDREGALLAGVSVSMPRVRYRPERLPGIVATLRSVASGLDADLARS